MHKHTHRDGHIHACKQPHTNAHTHTHTLTQAYTPTNTHTLSLTASNDCCLHQFISYQPLAHFWASLSVYVLLNFTGLHIWCDSWEALTADAGQLVIGQGRQMKFFIIFFNYFLGNVAKGRFSTLNSKEGGYFQCSSSHNYKHICMFKWYWLESGDLTLI